MNRRGVATVMVIVIIGLLAVVLTAVAHRVNAVGHRAAMEADEAQASRLLAAAKEIARGQLASTPTDGSVQMPVGTMTLTWSQQGPARTCVAVVRVGGVGREATLSFTDGRVTKVE